MSRLAIVCLLLACFAVRATAQESEKGAPTQELGGILDWCTPKPPVAGPSTGDGSQAKKVVMSGELRSRVQAPGAEAATESLTKAPPTVRKKVDAQTVPALGRTVFPLVDAAVAVVASIRANTRGVLFSASLVVGDNKCMTVDSVASQAELVVPAGFDGEVVVERYDVSRSDTTLSIEFAEATLESSWVSNLFVRGAAAGRATRLSLPEEKHRLLRDFGQAMALPCSSTAGNCKVQPAAGQGADTDRQARIAAVYTWLSEVVGRSWANEFAGSEADSKSEPMIVFFGLGGADRTLLLDCRADGKGAQRASPCRFAEPWQTTLQHAEAVWVVYIEDESSPFETTVDVEFRPRASDVDYEAFDARAASSALETPSEQGDRRTVRIGYKRFQLRDAPIAAQVAFTRQGPAYGLRQWQRVYRKLSSRYWSAAATVMVTPQNLDVSDVQLRPGNSSATQTIETETLDSFLFGGLALRWPGIRARALDQPQQWKRFFLNAVVPDITAVTSLQKGVQIYGLSWPITDRIHVAAGWRVSRDRVLKPGRSAGEQIDRALTREDVTNIRHRGTTVIGFSVDVFRTR